MRLTHHWSQRRWRWLVGENVFGYSRFLVGVAQFLVVRPRVIWEIFVAGTFLSLRFSVRKVSADLQQLGFAHSAGASNCGASGFFGSVFRRIFLSYERIVA